MFDPFYGVLASGKTFARWMNRLLLICELGAIAHIIYTLYLNKVFYRNEWLWIVVPFASFIAINIVNRLIRFLWNIIVAIRFGTTDGDEIAEHYAEKQEERALAKEERRIKREERRIKREQAAAQRKLSRRNISKQKLQSIYSDTVSYGLTSDGHLYPVEQMNQCPYMDRVRYQRMLIENPQQILKLKK